jgi:cell division protein FtsB
MRFYRGDSPFETATRKGMRRLLLALPVLLTAYLFLAGESGLFRVWDRAGQIAEVRAQIGALKVENARMVGEVDLLKNDLKTIERIARERYGMVKPNESVYMVYPEPPAKKLP